MNVVEIKSQIEKIISTKADKGLQKKLKFCLKGDGKQGIDILDDSYKIKQFLDNQRKQGRLLRVGIVGQIKAGKSSLLNAVLFDGENVLPKAATPMTAALTIMKYGEHSQAEVEFFTQKDIERIKDKHRKYEEKVLEFEAPIFQKISTENSKNRSLEELRKRAKKLAISEVDKIKGDDSVKDYKSSYEHFEKIKSSGINYQTIKEKEIISNDDIDCLINEKLQDYIGVNGEYTPFTKSVTLTIKKQGLQDIEVVDTPGINDPVVSRGERTKEELDSCNVILFLSPMGRFLDLTDQSFLVGIFGKKGIMNNRIYPVATKADDQLHGDLVRNSNGNFNIAMNLLQKTCITKAEDFELEIEKDKDVIHPFKNKAILTCAGAYSLLKFFDEKEKDSGLLKMWENLSKNYSSYFQSENIKESLNKLANVTAITEIFEKIRKNKIEIANEDIKTSEEKILSNLKIYLKNLITSLTNEITNIKNSDLSLLEKEKNNIELLRNEIITGVNKIYKNIIAENKQDLIATFERKITNLKKGENEISSKRKIEQKPETKTRKVSRGMIRKALSFLTFGLVEDYYYEDYIVYNEVKYFSTEDFKSEYEDQLKDINEELNSGLIDISDIRDKLNKNIKSLFKNLEKINPTSKIDASTISNAINVIVDKIPSFEFRLNTDIPDNLKETGLLTGSSIDRYVSNIKQEYAKLETKIRNQTNSFIREFDHIMSSIDVSGFFINELDEQINDNIIKIKNKEKTISEYNDILNDINEIKDKVGA